VGAAQCRLTVLAHRKNAPLYSKSFGVDSDAAVLPGQQSEETQFLFMAHAALDVFEEKSSAAPAPGMASDLYLGLLYPTDTYQVFGYVTNTKTKLIVITDDADVKDLDVKSVRRLFCGVLACFLFAFIARLTRVSFQLCKRLHLLWVDAVCNPFYTPGEPLRSTRFDKAIAKLVSTF
jgi:hypothetical protein